eukprot:287372-Hanusia_phi.AAC.2
MIGSNLLVLFLSTPSHACANSNWSGVFVEVATWRDALIHQPSHVRWEELGRAGQHALVGGTP